MKDALRDLCQSVIQQESGLSDGQLLECFLVYREERAFTALVHRHGPMVLSVCRRVLQNVHDAEDAFQATFLVLARKAATIAPPDAVGAWLYGVAHRTAKKAKAMTTRRRLNEQQFRDRYRAAATSEDAWEEWQPLLDEELSRLPPKYQSAIVLCELEGKTKREAAGQLGCPEGTLSSWLVRGRRLLARRLARRGVALSAGSLGAALSANTASGGVRTSLIVSTGKAAVLFAAGQAAATGVISARVAALTEGVLKAMLLSKLGVAMVVLLVVSVLGVGVAFQSYPSQAAEPARVERPQPIRDAAGEPAPQPDPATAVQAQIARVLKAHGGEQRLERLTTFTLRVRETSSVGDCRDYHVFAQLPDRVRLEHGFDGRADGKGKLIVVANGDKRWRKINDGEAAEERWESKEDAKFFGPRALSRLKDPAMKVSLLGERMAGDTGSLLGDRATICLELSRKDGKPLGPLHAFALGRGNEVRLYFDKDSGLLLKEEWNFSDLHCELFYADYKRVDGIAVAQKLAQRTNGEVNYRSEVEFNIVDKLDAKLFRKP
jgi:RNA polymerase sigma factor (sigma-70 family)